MNSVRNVARPALALVRSASSHHVAKPKPPTYDSLLKPSGNFQELYAKKQAKYNAFLIGSTIFGLSSMVIVYSMGFIDFVDPPKIPK